MISPLATLFGRKKSGGSYLPPLVGLKEPVLSSALLTASLLPATLLTATLFFTLALLTFTLLSLSILLLSALLSGKGICPVHLDFVLCP